MGNITYGGHWDFANLKYIDLDDKEQEKHLVHKGQLLFNRTNSKDLVGKTAVYRESKPIAFAGYLVRLVTNEKANAEYVSAFMNSEYMKLLLQAKCKNIIGMANINAQELQNFQMPLPPINIQNQFARSTHATLAQKQKLLNSSSVLEKLFSSLQARAFSGDLTTDALENVDPAGVGAVQGALF